MPQLTANAEPRSTLTLQVADTKSTSLLSGVTSFSPIQPSHLISRHVRREPADHRILNPSSRLKLHVPGRSDTLS